jgi:hypothetical protein
MIENFLRVPRTPGLVVADAVRVVAIASVVAVVVWGKPVDVGVLALALPGVLAARVLGLRGTVDAVIGAAVLLAAWSSVLDIYERIGWWDLLVHFLCTGAVAMLAAVALHRGRALPDPAGAAVGAVVVTTCALGLALSALWEVAEWVGHTLVSEDIFVAYDDTIGDMVAGGLGAAIAGVMVARVRLLDE